jgi:hypothetical protein
MDAPRNASNHWTALWMICPMVIKRLVYV